MATIPNRTPPDGSVTAAKLAGDALDGVKTFLVASATAPQKVKDAAHWVCDGVDDHVEIQAALDEIESTSGGLGGTVLLSSGYFECGPAEASTRIAGTGAVARRGTGTTGKLDVGANHAQFAGGDMVVVRGGDRGGGVTMQDRWCDGIYRVGATEGADLGATEIELIAPFVSTFADADYVRPRWSIRMPLFTSLVGAGKMSTILRLRQNANCSLVFMEARHSAPTGSSASTGVHELHRLSVQGRGASHSADWWEVNGVLTGSSFDVHIVDSEIRYFLGYGLCVGEGWGFKMRGGWIEDCEICAFTTGSPFFSNVKIQQGVYAALVGQGLAGGPHLDCCELRSNAAGKDTIISRGLSYGLRMIGGELAPNKGTQDIGIRFVDFDGRANATPVIEGVRFSPVATSYLIQLNNYVYGGRITGSYAAAPQAVVNGLDTWLSGVQLDIAGGGDTQARSADGFSRSERVRNESGGAFEQGKAYCWKSGGALDAVELPTAANDARFAGTSSRLGTANNGTGYLYVEGRASVLVDAGAGGADAIAVNDLLCLSGTTLGAMRKAGVGDTAVARALAAKASGTGVIAGYLIPPRVL